MLDYESDHYCPAYGRVIDIRIINKRCPVGGALR